MKGGNEMKKTTYNCKQNDAVIRMFSENGEIDELWVKIKGETTWTVIGYNDLLNAIDKAHRKNKVKRQSLLRWCLHW